MQTALKIFYIQVFICLASLAAKTQTTNTDNLKLNTPGPANQDTTKFATFYIIRPDGDVLKNYWMGIYFDEAQMIRINNNTRCVIKYAKTGSVEIWSRNEQKSSVNIQVEAAKKYYVQATFEAGGKTGFPKIVQLNDEEGEMAFNKTESPALYVYDPDPFTNSKYIEQQPERIGYIHMKFYAPLSVRHYFASALDGFIFSYYNKILSPTFSEADGVFGERKNLKDKDDFYKFAHKQLENLQKSSGKSATIISITEDSLISAADYIYSVYFIEKDSKPNVKINDTIPVLELRQYSTLIYKKDATTGKGDYYSIYFSERGLPEELHSKEEIKFKIQQLLDSCSFGNN